ncbi:hypothetical protein TNCV_1735741 [Trichonephila clavipes]|nr:hypothetical protein TNCV_1735741 [Trichonephila clavipes]
MKCMYEWFAHFQKEGSVSDNPRSGRLVTSISEENIEKMRKLITKDRYSTMKMIVEDLQINRESIIPIRCRRSQGPLRNTFKCSCDVPSSKEAGVRIVQSNNKLLRAKKEKGGSHFVRGDLTPYYQRFFGGPQPSGADLTYAGSFEDKKQQ